MNTEKEKRAIKILQQFEPQTEPYYLCYSGGKDSDTIKLLAGLAGVKFEAVHNLTTADAPETVYYIRSQSDVRIDRPNMTMWDLIPKKKIPPTRIIRYCCEVLKERGGQGRVKITGVRWAESPARRERADVATIIGKPKATQKLANELGVDYRVNKQGGLVLSNDNDEAKKLIEGCYRKTPTAINPIVDWTDADVWEFLKYYGCEANPLYQCGFKRVGCIGCPMAGKAERKREFALYPKFRANYVAAFDRMVTAREAAGLDNKNSWRDGESVMRWWLEDDPNQITFEDLGI